VPNWYIALIDGEHAMSILKRWTDAKLDKEHSFAVAANDGSPECGKWLAAIEAEIARRKKAA
jgi:hypothetical protein